MKQFDTLTVDDLRSMGFRETIDGVPSPEYLTETTRLTKTQLCTLILIYDARTKGFGQIRDYALNSLANGTYIPSESVPKTLEEKGFASIKRRKQVARRTGRTASGFEKKKEGGYVNVRRASDELDAIARQLGFDGRTDDAFTDLAYELMQNHPNA